MRQTRAIVDLSRLERNYRHLQATHIAQRLMTVLKADGYGHGMLPIARFLQSRGQSLFAVAILDEAIALRQAGITGRILVLGPPEAGRSAEYQAHDIEMTVPSLHHLRSELPQAAGGAPALHLKLDTGMGRIGLRPHELEEALTLLAEAPGVRVRGVYSHLADAENLASDFAERQLSVFQACRERVLRAGIGSAPEFHLANSAGLLRDARLHFDYARVGYALWAPPDFSPPQGQPSANTGLGQVMTLACPVSLVKTTQAGDSVGYSRTYRCSEGEVIATLPIGYGDGYPRGLSNRGQVLLAGRRFPVVGNVSMDQTTISLGQGRAAVGDAAILMGGGEGGISVAELAGWAGTIGYEVFTRLTGRVPRVYVYDGREIAPP